MITIGKIQNEVIYFYVVMKNVLLESRIYRFRLNMLNIFVYSIYRDASFSAVATTFHSLQNIDVMRICPTLDVSTTHVLGMATTLVIHVILGIASQSQ